MWRVTYLFLIMTTIVAVRGSERYRVLFVGGLSTKSHMNFYKGIINELANSNHHVTVVTPYGSNERRNANIKEIVIPESDFSQISQNRFNLTIMEFYQQLQIPPSMCVNSLRKREVQSLKQEMFDLILLSPFSDCFLSVVHHLKVPLIYVSPFGMTSNVAEVVGNPIFPSFVPMPALDYTYPLTFSQKTKTLLAELVLLYTSTYYVNRMMEEECHRRGLCQKDMPSFAEIRQSTSLVFVNSVRELESPARPYVPGVIHLGGIHCHPANSLPKDLGDWVEAEEEGFIFFSLGTAVESRHMPERHWKILMKVFGTLKQRVLWKWDVDSIPNMPSNVRVAKWLPQQDILGHPNLRLFISHGGLLSTTEAIYHGRPILGMPLFGDQMGNMREVERQGWGKTLQWDDLTEERLREDIFSVMNNKTMHQMVNLRSSLMKDQPLPPRQLATFWTDYVIRHKGARHLRCPIADMPWYKLYNVDVWLFLLSSCVTLTWLLYKVIVTIIRFILRKMKSKQD